MKQGWEIKRLEEVCDFQNGFAFKSNTYKKTGLPILRITNIQNQSLEINDLVYFDTKDYKENFDRYKVFKDDLVVAMSGATTGKLGINTTDKVFYLNQRVGKFIPKKELIKSYLYYFLSTKVEENLKIAAGAAQPNLSTEQIKNFKIPLPPLPEQQRIVAILDEAFASIAKAKANAEQNLKNTKELFGSYLNSMFDNIDEGWEEKTLGEVIQKTETVDPSKNPDESFIYIDVSSVNNERFEIEGASIVKGKNAPSRARKLIKTNDVIFATVRPTLKRVAIIAEEYNEQVCSTGYIVLRANDIINHRIIFYFLLTDKFISQMDKLQKGASYPAVTDTDVKCQIIPFPKSVTEQESIVKRLDAISFETKKLEVIYKQKLNDLEELKKSILRKAFNGESITI